jgi:hypothetical protein
MQSIQETVLEEFMQRSFGAQFLYIPKKYRKGNAQREPADLAWVTDDFVSLFYLRSSAETLPAQIEHNRRQAAGYHRLWSSGKTIYALRGKNRFGDECFVNYKSVRNYLSVLVVSEKCGIHFAPPITNHIPHAVVVIPELLLHWIAGFGGTIVDLLHIIDIYLGATVGAELTTESSFSTLTALVERYISDSLLKADPNRKYLSGSARQDYLFLLEHLSRMRLPASFGGAIHDRKGREQLSGLFCDFLLMEYASLAAGAENAIQASEPPLFKKWVVLKIKGLYYSFVVSTVHMGSANTLEVTEAAIEACKNEAGDIDSIHVQYGNVLDANEYRSPLMFTLPPNLPPRHSTVLAKSIFAKGHAYVERIAESY